MKLRFLGTLLVVVACAWAQQPSVQTPKSSTVEAQDYSLEAKSFIDALLKISARFRLPLGVEWVRTEDTLRPVRFSWSHATATEEIQSVVSMQAGYGWRTEDGVVHVFKRDLVADKQNPLNITIESFDEQPETVAWANNDLYQMVSHVVRHPELHGSIGSVLGDPKPVFRFAAQNVTARSILNKIVTAGLLAPVARMDRVWIVTFPETPVLSRTGFLHRTQTDSGAHQRIRSAGTVEIGGCQKKGSPQESDGSLTGVRFVAGRVSVDWRVETRRLDQDSRLARLHCVPPRD